jgi:hypothetical protein
VNADELRPHRHEPPPGWPPEVFAAVTDALAAALVASWRRSQREDARALVGFRGTANFVFDPEKPAAPEAGTEPAR